jgi:hypothetical protein
MKRHILKNILRCLSNKPQLNDSITLDNHVVLKNTFNEIQPKKIYKVSKGTI